MEMLLEDAADATEACADLDEAEVWVSSAQILLRPFGSASSPVLPASTAVAAAETYPSRGDQRLRSCQMSGSGRSAAADAGGEQRGAARVDWFAR